MEEMILLGRSKQILEFPQAKWDEQIKQIPQHGQDRLRFMTEAHHRVRYFVVQELADRQKPVGPETISEALDMPPAQVSGILDELEQKLFFLVRDRQGAVAWAYPVTIEPTPHTLNFSTGERLYGAWAEDALAVPFVEGQLRGDYLSVEIETKCSHCSQAMHFTVDSRMRVSVREAQAAPLVFMPDVDWVHFAERTIIDSYWRNSVFFWSEEHARQYRTNTNQVDGTYLTLEQCATMTPLSQGTLFAFRNE
jgi:Alkylmercury lyase